MFREYRCCEVAGKPSDGAWGRGHSDQKGVWVVGAEPWGRLTRSAAVMAGAQGLCGRTRDRTGLPKGPGSHGT